MNFSHHVSIVIFHGSAGVCKGTIPKFVNNFPSLVYLIINTIWASTKQQPIIQSSSSTQSPKIDPTRGHQYHHQHYHEVSLQL
mmetsp:Transcript_18351/g.23108  ORF Transcript_18351/g.23108 Transcript_18351/m.23108 type:complete len:83 (+) Transcript_18351:22-270(+)